MNKSVNQFTYTEGDQCVAARSPARRGVVTRIADACSARRYVFMNSETYEETRLPKARSPRRRSRGLRLTRPAVCAGHLVEVPEGGHERQPAHVERQGD